MTVVYGIYVQINQFMKGVQYEERRGAKRTGHEQEVYVCIW